VLSELQADPQGYDTANGTLRFPADAPLPGGLVTTLVATRLRELD
jgi:uncharacterized protein YdhG (YjbR/CyaY superfamily)